ncbi:MAG: hypothetical protein IIC30_00990, partial [Chloroflexi bacterium]|nr:hypothetical protein [Chloroflexota bacterium]
SIPPSIAIASGWNLVGVTDVTGDPSDGSLRQPGATIGQDRDTYFPAKVTQVYNWDATGKIWSQLTGTTMVKVGDAYWAFATGSDVIVP